MVNAAAASIKSDPEKGIKVDAALIARPFRDQIQQRVAELKERSHEEAPLLVGLLANDDPAALKYAEWTGKACRNDGLRYELRRIEPVDVEDALQAANDDPRVHGILVYYPIFGQEETFSGASQDDYLRDSVSHKCDVEGLCHLYRSNLFRNIRYIEPGVKCLVPCTALSVVKILEACEGCFDRTKPVKQQLKKHTITIVNRSEIVGRPLAAMLANDGAAVYSVDIDSIYLFTGNKLAKSDTTVEECVRKSSIVITGVPSMSYRLNTEWVQQGTIVVNVASFKNVDEAALLKIPGVRYVPQVGKVTVAMLERNLMRLYDQFHRPDRKHRQPSLHPVHWYTAIAVSALVVLQVGRMISRK